MQPQKIPAPTPQDTFTQQLLNLMQRLGETLEDEIVLLEKRSYTHYADILRRKQELTHHYQTALKSLNDAPDKAKLINLAEKAHLQAQGRVLEAVTQRNAKALRIAQASSERLLDTMMNEVRKELHRESGYSRGAIMIAAQKDCSRPVAYSNRI
jgi:hypothetical protein